MNYFGILKDAFSGWSKDKASVWAASMAYFTVFSLSPLLLLITALAGIFLGEQAIQGKLFGQIEGLVGAEAAMMIEQGVSNTSKPTGNIIATVIGFLTLILGASGVFGQLQQAFNAIWKVKPHPKAGIGAMIREKVLSFSMLLIIAFLLAISVGLSFFTNIATNYVQSLFAVPLSVMEMINLAISFVVMTLLFGAMFKILPSIEIPFKAVIPGAVLTALLFVLGKFLIGWYIGRGAYTSTYGAAGSLLIILVWVYYSVQLLLLGAEFTRAYAHAKGIKVRPAKNAVSTVISPQKIREQAEPDEVDKSAALVGYAVIGATKRVAKAVSERTKKTSKKKKK